MPEILETSTAAEIRRCPSVLQQLRPGLSPDTLLAAVRRMRPQGYRLARLDDERGRILAVAGYRVMERLRTGPVLEVDDLVTDVDARSAGHGSALLDRLLAEAGRNGCRALELDSAVHRHDAHRFYFRHGLHVLAYHFSLPLGERP